VTTVKGLAPQYVFYGGVTTSGIGLFRLQMGQQGIANIPLGGGDGISDGSAATKSSFLQIAGAAGDPNTYSTVAGPTQIPNAAQFAADYKAMFNTDPGAYSAAGYACAQVYLQALAKVGAGITDPAALREAVRGLRGHPVQHVRHCAGHVQLRRQRRHQPEDHLLLPVRRCQQELEVPQAA